MIWALATGASSSAAMRAIARRTGHHLAKTGRARPGITGARLGGAVGEAAGARGVAGAGVAAVVPDAPDPLAVPGAAGGDCAANTGVQCGKRWHPEQSSVVAT